MGPANPSRHMQLASAEDPAAEPLLGMGGHGVGVSEPSGQKWSAGHRMHQGWPVWFWYVPGSQAVQLLLSPLPENPVSHTQWLRLDASAGEVSFSGHGVGAKEAGGQKLPFGQPRHSDGPLSAL